MRHIALGGMSFCGSTVLSYILGSLPGVANIGESHWLTEDTKAGERIYCAHCGRSCPVLTEDFRDGLRKESADWYRRVGHQLDTDVLVSSDKAPVLLDRLDPERNFDLVVLYKPVELQARSYARIMSRDGVTLEIKKYLDQWSTFYTRFIDRFDVRGTKLFIDAQVFYSNPEHELAKLCAALNVRFHRDALVYWSKEHHCVGGNFNPYSRLLTAPDTLPVEPVKAHPLEEELLTEIRMHRPSQQVLERMTWS